MKKRNEKGFLLAESIIVGVFVLSLFTFLFVNIIPLVGEYENEDKSIEFIEKVCTYFNKEIINHFSPSIAEQDETFKGIDEVRYIGSVYGVEDVNKIKPGVGETTRVLLRRLPDRVLMRKGADEKYLKHIKRLCEEKNVPIEYFDLKKYNVCGIIKDVADLW